MGDKYSNLHKRKKRRRSKEERVKERNSKKRLWKKAGGKYSMAWRKNENQQENS